MATSFYNERNEDLALALVKLLMECDQALPNFLEDYNSADGALTFTDDEALENGDEGTVWAYWVPQCIQYHQVPRVGWTAKKTTYQREQEAKEAKLRRNRAEDAAALAASEREFGTVDDHTGPPSGPLADRRGGLGSGRGFAGHRPPPTSQRSSGSGGLDISLAAPPTRRPKTGDPNSSPYPPLFRWLLSILCSCRVPLVIVCPTRELAIQIFDEYRRLCYRTIVPGAPPNAAPPRRVA